MKTVPESDPKWERLVTAFRRVCMLRHQGKQTEANRMLANDLPVTIAEWSRASPMHVAEKKHDLEDMFKAEQKRVSEAWLVNQCVTQHWTETLLPELAGQMAHELRNALIGDSVLRDTRGNPELTQTTKAKRRAGFDDIPAVIDLVLAEQLSESRRALAA